MARLSDEWICRGREFQLLGEYTQKVQQANDDLAQEGTARSRGVARNLIWGGGINCMISNLGGV